MFESNENKALSVVVDSKEYYRIPIKTRVIYEKDNLEEVVTTYANEVLEDGDLLFITEKIVAIMQGRSFPIDSIKAGKLAHTLSKYVTKTPHGIGLGMPETMQMALDECGVPRILFASGIAAIGKLLGRKGDFYRVAGEKARSIDGPTEGTLPPYDKYVVLGPQDPQKVAQTIKKLLPKEVDVAIVDINDLGGNILGSTSTSITNDTLVKILKDNPLGQESQATPMGIVRKVKA